MDTRTMFEIRQTESHGKALVATQRLDPGPLGLEVLREKAIFVSPPHGSDDDHSEPAPWSFKRFPPQFWTDYWYYQQQTEITKRKIMEFYAETECADAQRIATLLRGDQHSQNSNMTEKDIAEFVRLMLVMKFNAAKIQPATPDGSGRGKDFGGGLFELACRMSHSCKPNCVWFSSSDGQFRIVRVIQTVEEGEELSVDYHRMMMKPTHQRQKFIQSFKNFLCDCPRCTSEKGDDTRPFKCCNTSCTGVHFVNQNFPGEDPDLLDCISCGTKPTKKYVRKSLAEESRLLRELESLECAVEWGRPIANSIRNLRPLHPCHWLSGWCFDMQKDLFLQLGSYSEAAKALEARIRCHNGILGESYAFESTAFDWERLGDALQHYDLDSAENAYKQAVRILHVTRGGLSEPYSKCAIDKLCSVQSTLPARPHHQERCGLCGIAANLKKCGRCNQIRYCSKDHQRAHWKVHKRRCLIPNDVLGEI